jgi:endo-1,4-beta-xylanase
VNLPDGLFPERTFYFGTVVLGQASLVVSGLQVGTEPEGRWVANPPDLGPGLASLAGGRNIGIGTLFDRANMIDRRYCQCMQRNFSIIAVPEINWVAPGAEFWAGRDQYAFETVDRAVDIAQQYGWQVFGSHLVWGAPEAIPDWLMNSSYTREEYISILQEYVETVVGRYRGRVQLWSIANEAAERDFYYPQPYVEGEQSSRPALTDFWYEKIGPEYIEMAFRWAREADPDAILVFNRGENPPPYTGDAQQVMEYGYGLLQDMTARGVPIDAVGLQFHLLGPRERQEPPQREPTIQLMQEYAELGLRVYITEFEVDLGSTGGTQEERYAYQAQIYRDMLEACLESGACDGFITWGLADSLSWIVCSLPFPHCMNEPNGDPLIFDRDFNPKPAYYAMRDALQGIPSSSPTTPTPRPTTQEAISNCVAQLAGAPRGEDPGGADIRDDFGNPVYDGFFNTAIWRQSGGLLPNSIAQQQEGVLVFGNAGDLTGLAAGLTVRAFDGIPLDQPISFEADLALCSDSSSGGVNIGVDSVGFEPGSWMADCNITFVSGETRGSCEDFLWTQQVEHAFETPRQPLGLGTWHSVRIDLDPATMSLTYTIDGQVVGTHVPEDGEALRAAMFQLVIGMWKPSADSPLLALVDNVRIGSVVP